MSDLADPLRSLLARPGLRLAFFALAAIAAFYLGFVHFPVPVALSILRQTGYYVILLTFALWLVPVWRQVRAAARSYRARRGAPHLHKC